MPEYISFIQEKERKRLYQIQLNNNLKEIDEIKNIVRSHSAKIEKFNGVKNQIKTEIQNESAISELKRKLNKSSSISTLETVLAELENIKEFPTSQTENETKNQIAFCYGTMKMEDISTSIESCKDIKNKINIESNRIEQEERARQKRLEQERRIREEEERYPPHQPHIVPSNLMV